MCSNVAAEADEVQFYDAVENEDDLESIEDNQRAKTKDPRLIKLQSQMVKLGQSKAAVRNKKVRHLKMIS